MRAIFPASFDPITNGHVDIAARACRLFDDLVIAVYDRPNKGRVLFSVEERVAMAEESTRHLPNTRVLPFSGLMVRFAREIGAGVVVRGMRASSDFEAEFQLGAAYYELDPELEVVLLMGRSKWSFISSTLIKEIASLGGAVEAFVPPPVAARLREHEW